MVRLDDRNGNCNRLGLLSENQTNNQGHHEGHKAVEKDAGFCLHHPSSSIRLTFSTT